MTGIGVLTLEALYCCLDILRLFHTQPFTMAGSTGLGLDVEPPVPWVVELKVSTSGIQSGLMKLFLEAGLQCCSPSCSPFCKLRFNLGIQVV